MKLIKDNKQLFYIYDESCNKIGAKDRHSVHRDGNWHRAVQLNLYHNGLLLMQKRSQQVDIAKTLFDQSLATQLLVSDNENDMSALKRGSREELGIDIITLDIKYVAGPKKMDKHYEYDPNLHNREFVSLYQANLPSQKVVASNPKVDSLFWIPVEKVKRMTIRNPENFTKTFTMWLKEVM